MSAAARKPWIKGPTAGETIRGRRCALLHRTDPLPHSSRARASLLAESAAKIRPATAAAAFGGLVGLAIGCAYLGGAAAKTTSVRAQAVRLDGARSAGFTEEALSAAAGGLNASALAIARRHDPYTVAGGAQRDRQTELLTARLETLRGDDPALRRISLSAVSPARPFRLDNALDASRDLECLTQAVYYEARGEGRDGMQAVAQVVLNRARHPAFPRSVCGVVFQGSNRRSGCQFSFTCDGSMRGPVNRAAWNRAQDVASKALSGAVYAPVGSATHFHTTGVSPNWRNTLIRVSQVGDHLFYRFGGRAGSSAAFAYTPSPSTEGDMAPRLVQASMDPIAATRQAGQAVAYTLILAQEGLAAASAEPAQAQVQAPAQPAVPAPAPAQAAPDTTPETPVAATP